MEQGPSTPRRIKTREIHKTGPHKGSEGGHGLFYYLLLLCLFGSLLPYLVTTSVTCALVKRSFREEAFNHLISVRDIKKQELENFFIARKADTYALAISPLIVRAASTFIDAFKQGGIEGNLYKEAVINYGGMLDEFSTAHEYYDILVADMEGNVVAGTKNFPILGKNILAVYPNTPLAGAFKHGKSSITVGDMRWHEPYKGPAIFISAPLVWGLGGEKTTVGVLIAHVNPQKINEIMAQRPGLGETGETYLVGQDLLMRSDSRFVREPVALKKKVDTVAVREALAGQSNCKIIRDYRDKKVLSAYTPLDITEGLRWALIAEIDKAEALGLQDTIFSRMTLLMVAMLPLWGIIIFIFYRLIKSWHLHEILHTGPVRSTPPYGPKA